MELNLDFLKNTGEALKNIGKKDDDKETDITTKSIIEDTGDAKVYEESHQEDEGIITTKDKQKDTEESLEEKLENIEKVIDTFSGKGTSVLNSGQSVGQAQSVNLNQQPLDLGTTQAKAYQAEYLKPSTVHDDRIALLYDNLKKYNLI